MIGIKPLDHSTQTQAAHHVRHMRHLVFAVIAGGLCAITLMLAAVHYRWSPTLTLSVLLPTALVGGCAIWFVSEKGLH